MKTLLPALFIVLPLLGPPSINAQQPYRLIPGGLVSGNARIQFLSQTLARLEYSPTGSFTDSLTAVVVNRSWERPHVSIHQEGDWVSLGTGKMTIKYRPASGPFSRDNLTVAWDIAGKSQNWTPADSDRQNLGGISSSLDGARRGRLPKSNPGILTRSGYFLLNDSETPVWDGKTRWIAPRNAPGEQDWYFFAYGNDYRHVLKEYAMLCGPIPMIPKYTLGSWATDLNYEYIPGTSIVDNYRYTSDSVRSIITRFRKEGIPLDVMVLDYAWHLRGWRGSYDWSPIFQNPVEFLSWARQNGINVTLNDHPGYGIESTLSDDDSRAPDVRHKLNIPDPPHPSVTISLQGGWKFRTDSTGLGVRDKWFGDTFDDSHWAEIQSDRSWEDQGYPAYDGVSWYRKWVVIPSDVLGEKLFTVFDNVDDEYDLYVNGREVSHHSPAHNTITPTDVTSYLKKGERNLIALRVNDWGGEGGISSAIAMISDVVPRVGLRFNLADKHQADVFMNVLHKPLIDQGVSFWWVDGGSGSSRMDGLNSQMWTNRVFYDYTGEETGKRPFIFSRYGGWGSHRYPSLFTGDTYAEWEVLQFQVPYTAQGGNILMPYITHDIGGFIGKNVSLDLYTRWLQFGVFSPLLRLHSAHENPETGNVRMPWTYGPDGVRIARNLFKLRYRLMPYIYTMTRIAHDDALPLVRPLYIQHPGLEEAYRQPYEYYFGDELLVAPILDSSGARNVYLPPGEWVDYFTGTRYTGDRTMQVRCSLETMPVYVRAGSIIPQQTDMDYTHQRPLDSLILDVYGPPKAGFTLYEDDGTTLQYSNGASAWTPISFDSAAGGGYSLSIGPTKGEFPGQPPLRTYLATISGITKPALVSVHGKKIEMGGKGSDAWRWDADRKRVVVRIGRKSIRDAVVVSIR